ncbi:MAG TPA: preprotein translocase subunit SecA [Nitrospiria bacterium]|nr:preprotein translocase subunit SecA [Nitrospiria bacterium]
MIGTLIKKVVGSKNDRELKRMWPIVAQINAHEPAVTSLDDNQLSAKTEEFRRRLAGGESIDQLLPEAFAVVRETARRCLGMRHFDVQLLGGVVLHEGKISEMKTGEGKTLVATLPLYLNALGGRGGHLITVNDYLAKRDAQWMAPVYHALGLTVGVIQHDASFLFDPTYETSDRRMHSLRPAGRRDAYAADITYGTNNEFGFDYLRDNMVVEAAQCVQRDLHYAIVDEVDSILIDEARTPLIISGPAEESTDLYYRVDKIIPYLKASTDYTIEEKTKTVALTEEGNAKVERLLGVDNLYDVANMSLVHHVGQALRAHTLYRRDVDYVVKDGQVIIVDEFTGRLMPGRRWSDGLHQAVEAKEGVKIASENQTLATITFQNYFRLYDKLAGMTGTADTEAAEFSKIYGLDVVVAPTHRAMRRVDTPDVVYRTEREKFEAIVEEIIDLHAKGQPVLVGTISIEKSERLSAMLKRRGVEHSVLNAKYHEKEAEIIAQAGRKGAVTIATNMAGRGTDILLGGNPDFLVKRDLQKQSEWTPEEVQQLTDRIRQETDREKQDVVALGGLHILGTERHESRRIDNQLRGRSGRQGDPGSSRFYLSLEDDLMRIFGSDRISGLMQRLGMEEGVPIEHRMVTRAIENAQKKVEAHNFEIRKQLLEYDDVMNKQREIIYERRKEILQGESVAETIREMIDERLDTLLELYCGKERHVDEWDLKGLAESLHQQFALTVKESWLQSNQGPDALRSELLGQIQELYRHRESELGETPMRQIERVVMLRVMDALWKDHLLSMDYLKEGIGLRGYGQRDPLVEYKREGFDLFADMMGRVQSEVIGNLMRVQPMRTMTPGEVPADAAPQAAPSTVPAPARPARLVFHRGDAGQEPASAAPVQRDSEKVGRNDPCPCGSGKKYKKCCGSRT